MPLPQFQQRDLTYVEHFIILTATLFEPLNPRLIHTVLHRDLSNIHPRITVREHMLSRIH